MERNAGIGSRKLGAWALVVALAALTALPAISGAGTVFVAPEFPTKLEPGENYPESRFGRGPGLSSRDEDAEEDAARRDPGASRRPAGLEFGKAQAQVQQEQAQRSSGASAAERMVNLEESQGEPRGEPKAPVPDSAVARKGVQEVALIAGDLGYFPKTVFVSRDVPVRMFVTGASKNTLCIMMDSFQVRRQVRSQKIEEITFTPNVPGKYRFYCPVNGMEGTLIVKELASAFNPQ